MQRYSETTRSNYSCQFLPSQTSRQEQKFRAFLAKQKNSSGKWRILDEGDGPVAVIRLPQRAFLKSVKPKQDNFYSTLATEIATNAWSTSHISKQEAIEAVCDGRGLDEMQQSRQRLGDALVVANSIADAVSSGKKEASIPIDRDSIQKYVLNGRKARLFFYSGFGFFLAINTVSHLIISSPFLKSFLDVLVFGSLLFGLLTGYFIGSTRGILAEYFGQSSRILKLGVGEAGKLADEMRMIKESTQKRLEMLESEAEHPDGNLK